MENNNQIKILKKLHKIMSNVERIEKDAKNTHQNYSYASERVIKEAIHQELVKNNVLFTISTDFPREENNKFYLDVLYAFYDVDSGEKIGGKFVGSGQARDEKGNYAAITGAIKYILTSTFLIPTGDDPEDDKNEGKAKGGNTYRPTKKLTTKQQEMIKGLRSDIGMETQDLIAYCKRQFDIKDPRNLNPAQASKLIQHLLDEKKKNDDNQKGISDEDNDKIAEALEKEDSSK